MKDFMKQEIEEDKEYKSLSPNVQKKLMDHLLGGIDVVANVKKYEITADYLEIESRTLLAAVLSK